MSSTRTVLIGALALAAVVALLVLLVSDEEPEVEILELGSAAAEPPVATDSGSPSLRASEAVTTELGGEPAQPATTHRESVEAETLDVRAEACNELAGVPASEAATYLSPCFEKNYPELAERLRSAPTGATLTTLLGNPSSIEWPDFDEATTEALAWFDQESDREQIGCPLVAINARFEQMTGRRFASLPSHLDFELPAWMEDREEIYDLVNADYDWKHFDGEHLVFVELLERRNRLEDRALASSPEAFAWNAVMREISNDVGTQPSSWLLNTFDDPCREPLYDPFRVRPEDPTQNDE